MTRPARVTLIAAVLLGAVLVVAPAGVEQRGAVPAPSPAPAPAGAPPGSRPGTVTEAAAERSASEQARRVGRPVEVSGLGTETNQVFANPAGSFRSLIHRQPVRIRQGGGWVAPDPRLQHRPDGTVGPVASAARLSLSGGGAAPLARLGVDDDATLTLRWPGRLPAPRLSGDAATYPDVLPGVDLVLRATSTGFSQVLVVRNAVAARQPSLARLRLGLDVDGLTLRKDGGRTTAVDRNGRILLRVGEPRMWDSAAGPDASGPAGAALAPRTVAPAPGDRHRPIRVESAPDSLTLVPDRAMLSGAGVTFPLYLNPELGTEVPFGRQHWAMVEQDLPTHNWWNSGYDARVGRDPADSITDRFRSYFQLNTSGLAGKLVKKAIVIFEERWRHSCTPEPVHLWHTGVINPSTTWSGPPGHITRLGTVFTPKDAASCTAYENVEFDVKALMSRAASEGWEHVTLALLSDETEYAHGAKVFKNDPVLDIEYNTLPGAPVPVLTGGVRGCSASQDAYVASTRPELSVRLEDADLEQQIRGTIEWRQAGAATASTMDTGYGTSGSELSVVIPATAPLTHGRRYEWRARAYNEISGGEVDIGPWSGWCAFTVDTVPPATPPVITADPAPGWLEDRPVDVTFTAAGDPDVYEFSYGVEGSGQFLTPATGGTATIRVTPIPGQNTITVSTIDRAGNTGATTVFSFDADRLPDAVGHWGMNDSGDSAEDLAGEQDATLTGGHTRGDGRNLTALFLDGATGSGGATAGPVVDTGGSFTVLAWVRTDADDARRTAVSQAGNRRSAFELRYDPLNRGRWVFAMPLLDTDAAAETEVRSNTASQLGVWTHLAGVYDHTAGQLRIYVNGRPAGTTAHRGTWRGTGPVRLGFAGGATTTFRYWSGGLDEVKLYPFAATERKIRQELPTDQWGGQGWWTLDEGGSARTAADSSYQGHELALGRNASWTPGAGRHGSSTLRLTGEEESDAYTAGPVVRTDASFTVAAWVRLGPGQCWVSALSQDGQQHSGFTLGYSCIAPYGWVFSIATADAPGGAPSPAQAASNTAPQRGVWTHLAGVYDHTAGQLRLFVNGRLAGSAAHHSTLRATGAFQIGRQQHSGYRVGHWPGEVDEARAIDQALTETQVRDWMQGEPFGPRAQWDLDENTGTVAADGSGNGHALVNSEHATWVAGKNGAALRFAGDRGNLTGGEAYTAGPVARTDSSFSVAAWVRLDTLATSGIAVSQDGTYDSGFVLEYNVTTRRWSFSMRRADGSADGAAATVSSTILPLVGAWTHLVGTYDAARGQIGLYVNGAFAGTVAHQSRWAAGGALRLGRGMFGMLPGGWLTGAVDSVRVLDWPLAAEQVHELLAPSSLGAGGWWRLDEVSGPMAEDSSGSGHPLAVAGGASRTGGPCSGALRLNGTNAYAHSPQPVLRTDRSFTLAVWVLPDTVSAAVTAVSQNGTQNSAVRLGVTGGRWTFGLGTVTLTGPTAVAGTWSHVAAVYDASARRAVLYVGGQQVATVATTAPPVSTGGLQVGRAQRSGAPVEYWPGVVDDARALLRPASAADVREMLNTCYPALPRTEFDNPNNVTTHDNSTVESTINVYGWISVVPRTLTISVVIRHTYRGDLTIDLIAPTGTSYRLKEPGEGAENDDVVETYVRTASGSPNGTWRLRVTDSAAADTGYVDSWRLVLD